MPPASALCHSRPDTVADAQSETLSRQRLQTTFRSSSRRGARHLSTMCARQYGERPGAAHRIRQSGDGRMAIRANARLSRDRGASCCGVADRDVLDRATPCPAARDALRQAVLTREPIRSEPQPAAELWPALIAGQWSLLDDFVLEHTSRATRAASVTFSDLQQSPIDRRLASCY
jgi:hypothetical protein